MPEVPQVQQRPSVGRVVHYILNEGRNMGQHRPALIVNVWADPPESATPQTACQLQVFTDSGEDKAFNDGLPQVLWKTSVLQGTAPGTWPWPEHVPPIIPTF